MEMRLARLCGVLALAGTFLPRWDSSATPQGAALETPSGSAAVTVATDVRFVAFGDAARVDWTGFDDAGVVTGFGSLGVSRGGAPNEETTLLFYAVSRCDALGCAMVEGGQGLIPSGDFSGGREHMRLDTDTSGNPTFSFFAGAGGPVSVDWRAVTLISTSFSGTMEERAGPSESCACSLLRRSQGTSSSTRATAAGSVIGSPIAPANFAEIVTNGGVTIEILRLE